MAKSEPVFRDTIENLYNAQSHSGIAILVYFELNYCNINLYKI